MQSGHDDFDPGNFFFLVLVDRHPAAVIADSHRTIFMQHHAKFTRMPGNGFINAVINHLLDQVVWAFRLGIHTRAFAYRFKPG